MHLRIRIMLLPKFLPCHLAHLQMAAGIAEIMQRRLELDGAHDVRRNPCRADGRRVALLIDHPTSFGIELFLSRHYRSSPARRSQAAPGALSFPAYAPASCRSAHWVPPS